MQKYFGIGGLLVAAAAIAWFVFQSFEIQGLEQIKLQPRDGATASEPTGTVVPSAQPGGTIRVASFNVQVFGEAKLAKPQVMSRLVDVARKFDVLAIQEVRAASQDVLPRFVEQINAAGRRYDYAVGPRLGRTSSKEQYAYVFDAARIEIDRGSIYTVSDPDDLLHREPLVAGFRVRGPPPERAFTFTLINIHTDPDETDAELDVLDDVFRAVRDDGRDEDDAILLGDLNVDDAHLGELGQMPGVYWVVAGTPTNTRGTKQYDNILLEPRATGEFTGRAGTFDLQREFNLSLEQALEISDHLPIWAEFSTTEGSVPGRIATRPEEPRRSGRDAR